MNSDERRNRNGRLLAGFGTAGIVGFQGMLVRQMTQQHGFQTGLFGVMRNLRAVGTAPPTVMAATGVMVGMGLMIGAITRRRQAAMDIVRENLPQHRR